MLFEEEKLFKINSKIDNNNARIKDLLIHQRIWENEPSIQSIIDLLTLENEILELQKNDILYGTHNIGLMELEERLAFGKASLLNSGRRLAKSNIFNRKRRENEYNQIKENVIDLENRINHLKQIDEEIMNSVNSRKLKM